jgi:F0F1-type ATP synthase delta subunit
MKKKEINQMVSFISEIIINKRIDEIFSDETTDMKQKEKLLFQRLDEIKNIWESGIEKFSTTSFLKYEYFRIYEILENIDWVQDEEDKDEDEIAA